jgi:hypothetical protein
MVEHIKEELIDFYDTMTQSSEKRKEFLPGYRAEELLAMIEGFIKWEDFEWEPEDK